MDASPGNVSQPGLGRLIQPCPRLLAKGCPIGLQAYQHARGKTLVAAGSTGTSITDAVAVVGDSQNTTPSSGPSQFVGMVGLRHAF